MQSTRPENSPCPLRSELSSRSPRPAPMCAASVLSLQARRTGWSEQARAGTFTPARTNPPRRATECCPGVAVRSCPGLPYFFLLWMRLLRALLAALYGAFCSALRFVVGFFGSLFGLVVGLFRAALGLVVGVGCAFLGAVRGVLGGVLRFVTCIPRVLLGLAGPVLGIILG